MFDIITVMLLWTASLPTAVIVNKQNNKNARATRADKPTERKVSV